jgi:hypothetical protein
MVKCSLGMEAAFKSFDYFKMLHKNIGINVIGVITKTPM